MAAEAQNLSFSAYLVYIFYSLLSSRYICRESFTNSSLFMQNKPNLLNAKMNISSILTKDYENKPRLPAPGKQTQSNPIPTNKFRRSGHETRGTSHDSRRSAFSASLSPNYHLTIHHPPFTNHESRFTIPAHLIE